MNLKITATLNISEISIQATMILRGVIEPRTYIVKDEKGDLVTDSYSILAMWKNRFSHLFNVHGVCDIRQTEINTA
jgi:uncharacterized protein YfkK (UPF0435 family)